MSYVEIVSRLASLTTVTLEDGYHDKHDVQGMVTHGPIRLDSTHNSNGFIFGTDVDRMFREAGWTLVGKNGAAGNVSWTLLDPPDEHGETDPRTGLTVYPNDQPLFEQIWVTDDGGDALRTFNAHIFPAPASFPWEKGGPPWIELGSSAFGTTFLCAQAVGGKPYSPGDWSGLNYYWMTFPLDDWGSLANERILGSNGFSAIAGNFEGGGKIYESQPLGTDRTNTMKLRVTMSMTTQNYDGNITILISALKNNGDDTYSKVGPTITTVMMAQPDYVFMIDPYSFYMFSLQSAFHADLYPTTTLFATMLNTLPAMPQHTDLPPIPQTAIIGTSLGSDLLIDGAATVWRYGSTAIPGSITFKTSGVSFQFIRNNAGVLYNDDDSDVVDSAKVLVSTDTDGAGGAATGPMRWIGNLWNGVSMQRSLDPIFTGWNPDIPDVGEELLPKTYRAAWFQSGAEEMFAGDGTMGTILLTGADYGYLNQFNNKLPDPITGFTPVAIDISGESNLFSPLRATSGAFVGFRITGGRPVHYDPNDPNSFQAPRFTMTAAGYPGDGSWAFVVDSINTCHLESASPGSVGTWAVTISVHDSFGNLKELLYNLVVGPSTVLRWANDRLPDATAGIPYFIQGGSTSTAFTFNGGILPPGMFFDVDDGTLSGIPGAGGLYTFAIGMTDGGTSITRNFIWQIN